MTSQEAPQEARVVVTAEVRRVQPCPAHAGRPVAGGNPNGWRPGCRACLVTPVKLETVEVK